MKIDFLKLSEIEARAAETYTRAIEQGVDKGFPFDVESTVEQLFGYTLHLSADLPPGVLGQTDSNNETVYISESIRNDGRLRFTVAHEIGHLVLHVPQMIAHYQQEPLFQQIKNTSIAQDSQMEWQANKFASVLLMPRKAVLERYGDPHHPENKISVREIADAFGTSIEAARVRLEDLGLLLRHPPGRPLEI